MERAEARAILGEPKNQHILMPEGFDGTFNLIVESLALDELDDGISLDGLRRDDPFIFFLGPCGEVERSHKTLEAEFYHRFTPPVWTPILNQELEGGPRCLFDELIKWHDHLGNEGIFFGGQGGRNEQEQAKNYQVELGVPDTLNQDK